MEEKKVYSLSQVAKSINRVISKYANSQIWIKAEIVKLNLYSRSGHCYPELVEKNDNKVIAEFRGNIWGNNLELINRKFKSVLNETLGDNMTVVFRASVRYHPVYGLTLDITDADPSYTLGELARQKAETINKLKANKIYTLNREKKLALVPKVIAIISVDTSKGYSDFINVLENNPWKYKFHYHLFPAILQGDKAIQTITSQLRRIAEFKDVFDAVAIIRGGGGEIGLSCYDDYELASSIAKHPLPVLTGIGHSTNETVCETVSFKSFITPTKIGEYLLQEFHNFSVPLEKSSETIKHFLKRLISDQKTSLQSSSRLFGSLTSRIFDYQKISIRENIKIITHYSSHFFSAEKKELKNNAKTIQFSTASFIKTQENALKDTVVNIKNKSDNAFLFENRNLTDIKKSAQTNTISLLNSTLKDYENIKVKLQILNPNNVLKRGFSITRLNGKSVQIAQNLKDGDKITTELYEGEIESRIESVKQVKK